jgi:hypothetical protein
MKEMFVWLAALAIIIVIFWSVVYEYNKKQSRTVEEYQKDVDRQGLNRLGVSLLRAGLLDFEKMLKPDLEKAIAFMQDEKKGTTRQKREEGDDKDSSAQN